MLPNRWSITNMKVWRCSCRVDLFFPFWPVGTLATVGIDFSQRKSAAVSGSFLLDLFTLFSFSLHISCYFYLLFLLSSVQSIIKSFSPSAVPVSLLLCLFLSIPLFCSLLFFLSFFLSLSFPFCCCPIPPPPPPSPSSPVSCVSVLCSRHHKTNRTVNLHCNTEFTITLCTASSYQWNRSALFPLTLSFVSSTSSSLLPSPLHLKSCRRQPAVG